MHLNKFVATVWLGYHVWVCVLIWNVFTFIRFSNVLPKNTLPIHKLQCCVCWSAPFIIWKKSVERLNINFFWIFIFFAFCLILVSRFWECSQVRIICCTYVQPTLQVNLPFYNQSKLHIVSILIITYCVFFSPYLNTQA